MKTLSLGIALFAMHIVTPICAQNTNRKAINTSQNEQHTKKEKIYTTQFIQFGIMNKNHTYFSKKYNIGVKYENCVISESLSQKAKANNKLLASRLDKKYGEIWKKDLGFIPYGL